MARAATFLVVGASAAAREQAIAALLANPSAVVSSAAPGPGDTASPEFSAVILEGLGVAATPLETGPGLQVVRIAPGCLCCDGNLVLRVTLNRLLRQRPGRLFLGLASSEHLDQLRSWLAAPPYDQLLALNPTVHA
ncbi:GTPase [Massilia oculi]|jgi:hypothetical protein|nr:GTPase [Massilia oculi]